MIVFLTTVPLARARGARKDHQSAHRTIMGLFPPLGDSPRAEAGVLFRVENEFSRLLVQSTTPPSTEQIERLDGAMKAVDLAAISTAPRVRYRIDAAAVRRSGRIERRLTSDEIPLWWSELADRHGLTLDDPIAAHLTGTEERRSVVGPQPRLRVASLAGTARIHDADRVLRALVGGVGRAKSYGCGLLSAVVAS